jgi:hypothetical protein
MEKLKVKNLDKLLQYVYEIGCEVEQAMSGAIKKGRGVEKTVLNVTRGFEKDYKKPILEEKFSSERNKMVKLTVGYELEFRWRIHIGYEDKEGKIHSCFSCATSTIKEDEKNVMKQSKRIANELQQIYELPYTPRVLKERELVN